VKVATEVRDPPALCYDDRSRRVEPLKTGLAGDSAHSAPANGAPDQLLLVSPR
jgi:hypothetical protein